MNLIFHEISGRCPSSPQHQFIARPKNGNSPSLPHIIGRLVGRSGEPSSATPPNLIFFNSTMKYCHLFDCNGGWIGGLAAASGYVSVPAFGWTMRRKSLLTAWKCQASEVVKCCNQIQPSMPLLYVLHVADCIYTLRPLPIVTKSHLGIIFKLSASLAAGISPNGVEGLECNFFALVSLVFVHLWI